MYFVGIDISKYKHDCFITTEAGEVIEENLSFTNTTYNLIMVKLTYIRSLSTYIFYI